MDFSKATRNFIQMARGKADEVQKTLISLGPNKESFSYANTEKPDFETLRKYYKDFQVFTSINVNAPSIIGQGFDVVGTNEKAVKLCREIQGLSSFMPMMTDGIQNTLLYGTGAIEIVWSKDKKRIVRLALINIDTVDLKWDRHGNITELKQKAVAGASGNTEPVTLDTDEFMILRFFRADDDVWGIGLVEPIMSILDMRQDMLINIGEIIKFLAMPPIQVKKHGAKTIAELMKVEESLKDFYQKHYFCTSEKYEITPIEIKRAIPDLSTYLDRLDLYMSIALRIPMKVLSGDVNFTTEAASLALREYGQDEKAYYRGKLAIEIEEQLFAPLCKANGFSEKDVPKVKWKVDIAEDPKTRSEVMLNKAKTLQVLGGIEDESLGKQIVEIRDKL